VAWLTVGALLVHTGIKLPVIRNALTRSPEASDRKLSRRRLLGTVGAAAGLITIATAGQTIAPLTPVSVLAPRRPTDGPQGLPVNKTAAAAGVRELALDPAYRLTVAGPHGEITLSANDLTALEQHTVILPIACVEGWSATGTWAGVRLGDLVAMVGGNPESSSAEITSLQETGRYRTSAVAPPHVRDPWTLIALRLNGAPLHLDHGYPARLIAPNRPGVLQTKWVARIDVREAS
jgi:DMSO/TMAO reductase YedYZ molybdopterin-dependent catalytic subunit